MAEAPYPQLPIPKLSANAAVPLQVLFLLHTLPAWKQQISLVYPRDPHIFAGYAAEGQATAPLIPAFPQPPATPNAALLAGVTRTTASDMKSDYAFLSAIYKEQSEHVTALLHIRDHLKRQFHALFLPDHEHIILLPDADYATTPLESMITRAKIHFSVIEESTLRYLEAQIHRPYDGSDLTFFTQNLAKLLRFQRRITSIPPPPDNAPLLDLHYVDILMAAIRTSPYRHILDQCTRDFNLAFPANIYNAVPVAGAAAPALPQRTFQNLADHLIHERDAIGTEAFNASITAANLASLTITGTNTDIQKIATHLPTTTPAPPSAGTNPRRQRATPPRSRSKSPSRSKASPTTTAAAAPPADRRERTQYWCDYHEWGSHPTEKCRLRRSRKTTPPS